MPTYEYQCDLCGHKLEAFQSVKDAALTDCPHCHKKGLSRLVSAPAFQLKGSGWYKTDYKPKPKESTETTTTASTETKDTKDSKTNDSSASTDSK